MSSSFKALGYVARLILITIPVVAIASLYLALGAAWKDMQSMGGRWQTTQWQTGKQPLPTPMQWAKNHVRMLVAIESAPDDPQLKENLGYMYGLRAANLEDFPELQQAMLDESIKYYREAITLRPMSPYAWANLALGLHMKKIEPANMWSAYARAWSYGNREAGVQKILAEIGFARWDEINSEGQKSLIDVIDNAKPHAKPDLVEIAKKYNKDSLLAPDPEFEPTTDSDPIQTKTE